MLNLVIGLVVTALGGGVIVYVLFGHRAEPTTSGALIGGVTMSGANVTRPLRAPDPAPVDLSGGGIRVSLTVRLRAALGLLLITLGTAALLATVVGVAVLSVGVLIQH
jgi:hypothetical protein